MKINLRKAEETDKKDILRIADELYLDIPDFVWNKDEFVSRQIENGGYYIGEVGGEPAGIISLRQRRKKMYVETLAVAKKYRNNGIGSELIKFSKNYTKER